MASLVNPTGILYFDIIYYIIILLAGPTLLMHMVAFRPKLKKLHDAYRNSGVSTAGLVVQRKIIVRRRAITRVEVSRTFEMRYAYREPGSLDIIYLKDFVKVRREDLDRRLFRVVVLPGQPSSGVPAFLVQNYDSSFERLFLLFLFSIIFTLFCVVVFTMVFALRNCTEIIDGPYAWSPRKQICTVSLTTDPLLSFISVMLLGFFLSYIFYRDSLSQVPGKVWKTGTCRNSQQQHRPTSSSYDLNSLDDRPIPMAEAVAILESEVEHNDGTDGAPVVATEDAGRNNSVGGALTAVPVSGLDSATRPSTEMISAAATTRSLPEDKAELPEASVMEVV